MLDDFLTVSEKPCRQSLGSQARVAWKPPPSGSFKVNIVGALFPKTKQAGVGVIVRDEEGVVVTTMSRKLDYLLGALQLSQRPWSSG